MTERSDPPDADEIVDDPYADADGRIGEPFRAEVGAEVAGLLAAAAIWESPSDDLGARIAAAVASETTIDRAAGGSEPLLPPPVFSPTRWERLRPGLLGAAAAIGILFGGVIVLSALSGNPEREDFAAELVPTGLIPDVEGAVEVTSLQSGLRIELDADTLPRRAGGEFYEGWLRLDDESLVPIGTFHEGDDVTLWAGVARERVETMTITLGEADLGRSVEQASRRVVFKVDFPQP